MLNDLQRLALRAVADFADGFSCIECVAIFGSVARGDHRPDSDLDVYVVLMPELLSGVPSSDVTADFVRLHAAVEGWAQEVGTMVGRKVSVHGIVIVEVAGDIARPAVLDGLAVPIATDRKAAIVPTPPKP